MPDGESAYRKLDYFLSFVGDTSISLVLNLNISPINVTNICESGKAWSMMWGIFCSTFFHVRNLEGAMCQSSLRSTFNYTSPQLFACRSYCSDALHCYTCMLMFSWAPVEKSSINNTGGFLLLISRPYSPFVVRNNLTFLLLCFFFQ